MKEPARILVVDDEPGIRQVLREGLEGAGYLVSEAGSRAALLKCLASEKVRLITLDLNLGSESGLDLAREIRARRNVPIIIITGRGEPDERAISLEHGADDYISKPFRLREVLLRVGSVLRRYAPDEAAAPPAGAGASDAVYEFEGGVVSLARGELRSHRGEVIQLTDAELALLAIFLRHPARVLSRDEIMQMLKGRDWSPLDRTIDGHVARLRRKLEPDNGAPTLIKTVRGVGYVLATDVRKRPAG